MVARLSFFLLLVLSLGATFPCAADPTPLPVLLDRMIARDDATQQSLKSMQYQMISHTEQLNSKDKVTHHEEVTMIVRPGAPQPYEILSITGDRIPNDPDQAAQGAKTDAIAQTQHDFSLRNMARRFDVTYVGPTNFKGQPAYILAFSPKPNQPAHDQTEKVINHLKGEIWVRSSDDAVLQTEAILAEPVPVAWVFAKVQSLDFHYELQTTTNVFGPALLHVEVTIAAPFIHIRHSQEIEMTDFEPRLAPGSVLGNGPAVPATH